MSGYRRVGHSGGTWSLVLMSCLLTAAGCGMGSRSPADNRAFLLQLEPPPQGPALAVPLRIRTCRVAATFTSRSLVYRLTTVQYQYDTYNAFLVPLADQVNDALSRWLDVGSGAAATPDQPLYTLEPYLESLVADFSDPNRPVASARMRFVLTRSGPGDSNASVVFRKNLIARVRLSLKPTADQVVGVFSGCLQEILTQLRAELAAIPAREAKKDDPGGSPLVNG